MLIVDRTQPIWTFFRGVHYSRVSFAPTMPETARPPQDAHPAVRAWMSELNQVFRPRTVNSLWAEARHPSVWWFSVLSPCWLFSKSNFVSPSPTLWWPFFRSKLKSALQKVNSFDFDQERASPPCWGRFDRTQPIFRGAHCSRVYLSTVPEMVRPPWDAHSALRAWMSELNQLALESVLLFIYIKINS